MEFIGTLKGCVGTRSGVTDNGKWERRQYLVEEVASWPKKMVFEVAGGEVGRYAEWDALIGHNVVVTFGIDAYDAKDGKWFNRIQAWKIKDVVPEPPKNEQ